MVRLNILPPEVLLARPAIPQKNLTWYRRHQQ